MGANTVATPGRRGIGGWGGGWGGPDDEVSEQAGHVAVACSDHETQ